jgi:hypothetical protein
MLSAPDDLHASVMCAPAPVAVAVVVTIIIHGWPLINIAPIIGGRPPSVAVVMVVMVVMVIEILR